MREEAIDIQCDGHLLAGSIAHADTGTAKALVVMFAGSGPIDRNENLPRFAMNIFNGLADAFAAKDYASFRYDKRGCGASGGDYVSAGHSDFVEDAKIVTQYFQQHEQWGSVPIILLGHSEGTVIAPQVANAVSVSGQILLCPFARPMREVLLQQATNRQNEIDAQTGVGGMLAKTVTRLRGGALGIQQKFLQRIENSSTDTITVAKATLNARWFRDRSASPVNYSGALTNAH